MAEDYMVVTFAPTGEVSAMHRDAFSLSFLGKQEVKRASEITFNEDTQLWDVYLPTGAQVHDGDAWFSPARARGFETYNGARAFEVRWLEACALYSVDPLGKEGIEAASKLRGVA